MEGVFSAGASELVSKKKKSINTAVKPIYTVYLVRVAGKLEPIPDDFRCEAGYTLSRSPICPGLTQRQTTITLTFTQIDNSE